MTFCATTLGLYISLLAIVLSLFQSNHLSIYFLPVVYIRPYSCRVRPVQTVLSSPACCSSAFSPPPAAAAGPIAVPCAAAHSQPGI